jgi:hypothetical protein
MLGTGPYQASLQRVYKDNPQASASVMNPETVSSCPG